MKPDMKYRPEIDGLRAVAVVPVVLFHAGFTTFSGGFVGVDVFFVISGYLITGIIGGEIDSGSFSIVRFYERRIRRILPALFVVSFACIPFAWAWMLPDEFIDFAQSLVAVNLFASNFLFWQESGYFSAAAELKPLLHTWSLAVEEQFYLFFPLFLLALRRCSPRFRLVLIIALSLASLGLSQWASKWYPWPNFYLLPTRAWELGAGAILALTSRYWLDIRGWGAQIVAGLGLAMISSAVFLFDAEVPFPSVWALIPVLGTAFVIACARPETIVGRLLSFAPLVGLGLISYSTYLWHQPLFAFAKIRLIGDVPPTVYIGLAVFSFVLAYASWRFVEQPFRNKGTFSRKQIFCSSAIVSVAIVALGLSGQMIPDLPGREVAVQTRVAEANVDIRPENGQKNCNPTGRTFVRPEQSCVYGNGLPIDVALWGDSHAKALVLSMARTLRKDGRGLRQFTYNGCAPAVGYYRHDHVTDCAGYNAAVLQYLLGANAPEMVILVGRWAYYLEDELFDNGEGGIEHDGLIYAMPVGRGPEFISDPRRVEEIGVLYRATIQRLLDEGKRVVLVYTVPPVGWDVPRYLAREVMFGIERDEPLSVSYEVFKEYTKEARKQLDMFPDHRNLIRIRPDEILCDTFVAERCVAEIDGNPLYADDDHLGAVGSAMLSEKIVAEMKAKGWL